MPAPFLPTSTIFSPRFTTALKSDTTCRSPNALERPSNSSGVRPDGRFVVIEMVDERAGRLGSYVFVENWATELLELAPVE